MTTSRRKPPDQIDRSDEAAVLAVLNAAGHVYAGRDRHYGRQAVYGMPTLPDGRLGQVRALVLPGTCARLEARGLLRWDGRDGCYYPADSIDSPFNRV